jgi:hypothetical protein
MPPDLLDPAILPFTFLLTLTIVLLLMHRGNVSASHFSLVAGLGCLSLIMMRNIPLFVLACAPILSELCSISLTRQKTWEDIEARYGAFVKSGLYSSDYLTYRGLFANRTPAKNRFNLRSFLFRFELAGEPSTNGNMFNEFNWGGYTFQLPAAVFSMPE